MAAPPPGRAGHHQDVLWAPQGREVTDAKKDAATKHAAEEMAPGSGRRRRRRLAHLCAALSAPSSQQQQQQPAAAAVARPKALITDIKTYLAPYFMVKVETGQGTYGWGGSGIGKLRGLAVKGAVDHYREMLLGRDAMEVGALWQEMYRSQYFEGGRVLTAAISAIDIALHDLVAKV